MTSTRRTILLAAVALVAAGAGAILLRAVVHQQRLARLMADMQAAEASYHAGLARTLAVSSESVEAGGRMADAFTCHGAEKSPPVAWTNAPAGVQSFALMMVDADVATRRPHVWSFTHWILYNIPARESSIGAGAGRDELRQKGIEDGENALGRHGYFGPCSKSDEHHYLIRVYALDVPRIRPEAPDRQGIAEAMKGHILAFGEVSTRAGNWGER